jgi:hypothetical protein
MLFNPVIGINGAKGDRGINGLNDTYIGVNGTKGAMGIDGIQPPPSTGDTGDDGYYGANGPKGDVGEMGGYIIGDTGPIGATGADGSKGVKGQKGSTGLSAAKGEKGSQGGSATGVDGDTGDKGDKGQQGIGPIGITGDSGVQGDTGDKGVKGDDTSAGADASEIDVILTFITNCIYPIINNPVIYVDGIFSDQYDEMFFGVIGTMVRQDSAIPVAINSLGLLPFRSTTSGSSATVYIPGGFVSPGAFQYGIEQECTCQLFPSSVWATATGGDAYTVYIGWSDASAIATSTSDKVIGYCTHTTCSIKFHTRSNGATGGTATVVTTAGLTNFATNARLNMKLKISTTRVVTLFVNDVLRVTLDASGITPGTNRDQRPCQLTVVQNAPTAATNNFVFHIDYVKYGAFNLNRIS